MKSPVAALILLCSLIAATAAPARPPDARWLIEPEHYGDDLAPHQRLRIQQQIAEGLSSAAVRAALPARKTEPEQLRWPLQATRPGRFGYHGISNYVDHDPAFPNRLRDYSCGTRTYDTAGGYNHAGTDYFLWPFPWRAMDEDDVAIVAAAAGVIVARNDGHPDRSCAMADLPWNAVYVRHDDGSVAWYGHMKRGSVTTRQAGDRVQVGEYLGLVGSSGSSTGPHLHFELHDAAGGVIDPRNGACNPGAERWQPPQPYEDPAINTLSLHSAQPQSLRCGVEDGQPVHEETYAIDTVLPGASFHLFAAYRDHRNGDISEFSVLRPDGSVFDSWEQDLADENLERPFYAATGWVWTLQLPADAPRGYWKLRAQFHGRDYVREFFVGTETEARDTAVRRERAGVAGMAIAPPRR